MKKKLLLIPILLIGPMMIGCKYDTPLVGVREWVKHNGYMNHEPGFSVQNKEEERSGASIDYDNQVAEIIYDKILDAEFLGENLPKNKKERTDVFVGYSIDCHLRQMNSCQIFIYDNGFITSKAYGDSTIWGSPKDQDASYRISKENAEYIIEKATERYLEIKETKEKEHAEYLERAELENVFKRAEETTEKLMLWSYTPPTEEGRLFDIPDENREFLDSLKSIEYEQKSEQWYYSRNRYRAISYSLDRDFTIAICQDETEPEHFVYDSLEVYVQSYEQYPISGNNFFYYEINPEVGKELVNKANEIMKAYVKSHQNNN